MCSRVKIIGLYKTTEAAAKAKGLMRERGIPDLRTSLLSPDDTDGPHLATYPHHQAATVAWLGAAIGAVVGGLALGASTTATVEALPALAGGHLWSALVGAALVSPVGALAGAIVGWRRRVLRADFFDADAKRGGTALGVVVETPEELETARYAFRATGALRVENGHGPFAEPAPGLADASTR
ncbi:MAG: hypothetical protein GWO04_44510 [Actinobacteria bacterium]|nr:hypothetical protein [Actinomycetota bacterium]NIW33021.1 hypothetical protein [Actinomycetota bacterium]